MYNYAHSSIGRKYVSHNLTCGMQVRHGCHKPKELKDAKICYCILQEGNRSKLHMKLNVRKMDKIESGITVTAISVISVV